MIEGTKSQSVDAKFQVNVHLSVSPANDFVDGADVNNSIELNLKKERDIKSIFQASLKHERS